MARAHRRSQSLSASSNAPSDMSGVGQSHAHLRASPRLTSREKGVRNGQAASHHERFSCRVEDGAADAPTETRELFLLFRQHAGELLHVNLDVENVRDCGLDRLQVLRRERVPAIAEETRNPAGAGLSAHSSRTGKPCQLNAIIGGTVCHVHGGRAPQVKRKAAERVAELRDSLFDHTSLKPSARLRPSNSSSSRAIREGSRR
jgi:hypothetical protein